MTRKNLELSDISALDFTTFCTRIADAYSNDTSSLDGSILALLAKRLVAAETMPGGPYKDEHDNTTVALNAAIGRLFSLMGKPLPNIDKYLTMPHDSLSVADTTALDAYRAIENAQQHGTKKALQRHASYRRAVKTLVALDEPIKTQTLQFLARIEAADTTQEIGAISQFAKRALTDAAISPAKLNALGEANVHSWIAYSIYDHILDKEADATLLPAANICMRIALKLYQRTLPARHPLQALVAYYFDKVDATSAWEITSCRARISGASIHIGALPRYSQYESLAWRSCIHVLGPLIVAASSSTSAVQVEQFTEGLHHYLIARQLGDDIHDWREDLTAGRISAVVALLLNRQHIQADTAYELEELIGIIQKDFLSEGAAAISKLISHHANIARDKLIASGCEPSSQLLGLILRLERMATGSIRQQQRFISFRDEYMTRRDSASDTLVA